MAWTRTPQFTITERTPLSYNFPSPVGMSNVGIDLENVSENAYARFGYLYVYAPVTIGGTLYRTHMDLGSIWRRSYRYMLSPASLVSSIIFVPDPKLPLPCTARMLYFTS